MDKKNITKKPPPWHGVNARGTDPLRGGYNADAPPQEDTIVLEKVKAPGTVLGPEWLLCKNRLGPHCLQQRKLSRRAAPGSQHLEGKEREEAGASAPSPNSGSWAASLSQARARESSGVALAASAWSPET